MKVYLSLLLITLAVSGSWRLRRRFYKQHSFLLLPNKLIVMSFLDCFTAMLSAWKPKPFCSGSIVKLLKGI